MEDNVDSITSNYLLADVTENDHKNSGILTGKSRSAHTYSKLPQEYKRFQHNPHTILLRFTGIRYGKVEK